MSDSLSSSRTTQTALGRRSKNSRTIRPILALEINKKRVTKVALDPFDLPLLAMALFDTIILCMGNCAEKGARMSDLYRGLMGSIRAMDPGADQNTIGIIVSNQFSPINYLLLRTFRDRKRASNRARADGLKGSLPSWKAGSNRSRISRKCAGLSRLSPVVTSTAS